MVHVTYKINNHRNFFLNASFGVSTNNGMLLSTHNLDNINKSFLPINPLPISSCLSFLPPKTLFESFKCTNLRF